MCGQRFVGGPLVPQYYKTGRYVDPTPNLDNINTCDLSSPLDCKCSIGQHCRWLTLRGFPCARCCIRWNEGAPTEIKQMRPYYNRSIQQVHASPPVEVHLTQPITVDNVATTTQSHQPSISFQDILGGPASLLPGVLLQIVHCLCAHPTHELSETVSYTHLTLPTKA